MHAVIPLAQGTSHHVEQAGWAPDAAGGNAEHGVVLIGSEAHVQQVREAARQLPAGVQEPALAHLRALCTDRSGADASQQRRPE